MAITRHPLDPVLSPVHSDTLLSQPKHPSGAPLSHNGVLVLKKATLLFALSLQEGNKLFPRKAPRRPQNTCIQQKDGLKRNHPSNLPKAFKKKWR